ncbi:MAG: hypothetical protein E3J94_07300 [Desulfobacteraceae bacterium]|nr:MAG: hypothetical protein E3J94_07055 [Desulfobacteraceae bacterium]TES88960.1 MAG: hypothetical protein E3J94_07300 [Desulfobacteraceae bacterium]
MLKTKNKIPGKLSSTVLIMGDGQRLPQDMHHFLGICCGPKSEGIRHDVFAVNRSINFYGNCRHWGTADGEEAIYQAVQLRLQHRYLLRHTLLPEIAGFDIFWEPVDIPAEDWRGNSALFATEACLGMGYKRIVLAGCPMNRSGHWYAPYYSGPEWTNEAYERWERLEETKPPIKSMSGWTKKLFGEPTKEWLKS